MEIQKSCLSENGDMCTVRAHLRTPDIGPDKLYTKACQAPIHCPNILLSMRGDQPGACSISWTSSTYEFLSMRHTPGPHLALIPDDLIKFVSRGNKTCRHSRPTARPLYRGSGVETAGALHSYRCLCARPWYADNPLSL